MKDYKKMEIIERRNKVYKMAKNRFLIPEIAKELNISAPTVRADLFWLGGKDLLEQVSAYRKLNRNNRHMDSKVMDLLKDRNLKVEMTYSNGDIIFSFFDPAIVRPILIRKLSSIKEMDFLEWLYDFFKQFNNENFKGIMDDIDNRIKQMETKNDNIKK